MKKRISDLMMKKILKNKHVLFAHWNAENKNDCPYQHWYLPLRDIFGKVSIFDSAKYYFRYGKEKMQNMLMEKIEKEKPDYVFFMLIYDEFDPAFLLQLKKIFPDIITINLFSDDDWRYEDFSRYYNLFFDYAIVNITAADMSSQYIKDGNKKFSLSLGMNCKLFKPLRVPKKYDLSFVGRANESRAEYLQFLIDNGIDVHVWGEGWQNYPSLSGCYHGHLPAEKFVEVINQTKINLTFTRGGYGKLQIKGRPFETAACGGFNLIEYFADYGKFFKEEKEMVMFGDKKELLMKIRHYLGNEKKLKKIADAAHKRMIKEYNKHKEIIRYFKDLSLIHI